MTKHNNSFWMPYTAYGNFSKNPRMIGGAKGMYYYDTDGRKMLDACAGLWCCNAGHCHPKIIEAIQQQAAQLDFSPTFQYGHPKVFECAEKIKGIFPAGFESIFFCNSGSEAADSALKIALAYQQIRGKGSKQLFIGRELGYHGVNFGGISVGGMVKNRMWYGNQLLRVDHLPATNLPENKFTKGEPETGAELADALTKIINLHGAHTIAAVIVEPVPGSSGVFPPPKGYLKRLRQICTDNDILLIFDEVITAFGRLGTATGSDYFGVEPDLLTFAKGSTSGTVPLGGVAVSGAIRQQFADSAPGDTTIDLFHGYTYSGHPLAMAASIATLEVYDEEGIFTHREELITAFEEGIHSLKGLPAVKDLRNIGFMGAIELEADAQQPNSRTFKVLNDCFHHRDLVLRVAGDVVAFSPPLIVNKAQIEEMFSKVAESIKAVL